MAAIPKDPDKSTVGVTSEESGPEVTESPEKTEEETEAPTPAAPRKKGSKPSLEVVRDVALNLDATGQKVTSSTLAKAFGVSDRTGARYLKMLAA
ncbi:hypothetical protein [Streptomyces sp. NPDC056190]|uniref:hypothetical protein n=1 Tax=Streptomyces sp. NPDC056190 TaxID=3345741 RepID=UPI0035DEA319